jgi:hypothetical protein
VPRFTDCRFTEDSPEQFLFEPILGLCVGFGLDLLDHDVELARVDSDTLFASWQCARETYELDVRVLQGCQELLGQTVESPREILAKTLRVQAIEPAFLGITPDVTRHYLQHESPSRLL